MAFILLTVQSGAERLVLREIGGLKNERRAFLREAYIVYGLYDIVASVEAESLEQLERLVNFIRGISQVRGTLTMIVAEGR